MEILLFFKFHFCECWWKVPKEKLLGCIDNVTYRAQWRHGRVDNFENHHHPTHFHCWGVFKYSLFTESTFFSGMCPFNNVNWNHDRPGTLYLIICIVVYVILKWRDDIAVANAFLSFFNKLQIQLWKCLQLGTFFVNREWACSSFVTKSGHADNPATFAPCVKSMTAYLYRKIHNVPHGGLPYNFVRRIFVT